MRVDHSQSDLKTSPSARFSNHSGRDQLSQVGSQINIITFKNTLLYNYMNIPKYTLTRYIFFSNGGWRKMIWIYDDISLYNTILNFENV